MVKLTTDEIKELETLIQKGGKGYRIKHAQILLKIDRKPENEDWTYDRIKDAYGASHSTIAGIAKRFVMDGMEAALNRKEQENRHRKVTGDIEAPDLCHSVFPTARRSHPLDHAGNCGRTDPTGNR